MGQPVTNVRPVAIEPGAAQGFVERFALWRWKHRNGVLATIILVPLAIYLVVFLWVPVALLAGLSLTEWNGVQWPPDFVGMKNYIEFFTDPYYAQVITNTVLFGAIVLVVDVGVGFFIAMLLNQRIHLRGAFRTFWYLPVIISGAVMAQTLDVFLYPGKIGVFNSIIGIFGQAPIIWNQSTLWMPIWVILFSIWRGIGYDVLFFLAGLQSLDPALEEAAHVDGAGRWQTFSRIIVPQLTPILLFVLIVGLVGSLQIWEAPLILTLGGPDNSTNTVVYSVYEDAFGNLTFGLAAAESVVLLVVLMVLSGLNLRMFRGESS